MSCEHGMDSLRDRFPTVRCLWNHRRHKLTQILMEARELLSLYCLTAYWPQRHRAAHSLLSRLSKLSKAVILSLICLSCSSPPYCFIFLSLWCVLSAVFMQRASKPISMEDSERRCPPHRLLPPSPSTHKLINVSFVRLCVLYKPVLVFQVCVYYLYLYFVSKCVWDLFFGQDGAHYSHRSPTDVRGDTEIDAHTHTHTRFFYHGVHILLTSVVFCWINDIFYL